MLNKYWIISLLTIGFGFFLIYSPQIDQTIALMPYNVVTTRFYGEVSIWCSIIYFLVPCVTVIFILMSLLGVIFSAKTRDPRNTRRVAAIVLLALALGPGLVVNTIFKDGWGRPRPYQVIRDHQPFKAVWQADFHAPNNNSFPGGHASIGFFIGVPFLAMGYRRKGLIVSAIGGSIVSLVRILQGGHYLSDVLFSAIFVWLIAELVTYIIKYLTSYKLSS